MFHTGLTCGTSYSLGVVARDAAGNSSGEASTNATTSACATPPPSGTWASCANEGQTCTFTGTKEMRYGANGTFTAARTFSSPTSCTNGVFGDPLPGVAKHCELRDPTSTPPPPPLRLRLRLRLRPRRRREQSSTRSPTSRAGDVHPEKISEVSTGQGPGFRFLADFPGGSGNGVQIVDSDHLVDRDNYLGTVTDFSGKFMFPSSGNPSGFPMYGDWNCLWEFGPGNTWNNQIGVDGYARKIYVRSYKAGAQDSRQKALASSPLQFDHWVRLPLADQVVAGIGRVREVRARR